MHDNFFLSTLRIVFSIKIKRTVKSHASKLLRNCSEIYRCKEVHVPHFLHPLSSTFHPLFCCSCRFWQCAPFSPRAPSFLRDPDGSAPGVVKHVINPFCTSHLRKGVPFLTTAIGSPVSLQYQWVFQHFTEVRPHSAVIEHFWSIFCTY